MFAIKRTGKCTGMLVSRCRQTRVTEVMLLRFIQGSGASVVFRAIGDAIPQFDQCELWRIYDVEVPGKCVRRAEALRKYGVNSDFEIALKYRTKLDPSTAAWPLTFPYCPVDWLMLNRLGAGSVVDIIGVVLDKPVMDPQSTSPKLRVALGNAAYQQDIEIRGEHAQMSLEKGNVLALAGVCVREYRGQRSLRTSLLTLIEVDPTPRAGLPAVEGLDEGTPWKKAMGPGSRPTIPCCRGHDSMTLRAALQLFGVPPCSTTILGIEPDWPARRAKRIGQVAHIRTQQPYEFYVAWKSADSVSFMEEPDPTDLRLSDRKWRCKVHKWNQLLKQMYEVLPDVVEL